MEYAEIIKNMDPYMKGYCKIVADGVNQRHPHLPKTKENLVVGGLMARIATLSIHLMFNPVSWTLNMATFPLRTQLECYIVLAWILKNVNENSKRYVVTSIWRNKKNDTKRKELLLEQENKRNAKNNAALLKERECYEKHSATQEKWRQEQMMEWGIDSMEKDDGMPEVINMAKEAGLLFEYNDMYRGLSVYSHNSWYFVYHSNTKLSADGISRFPVIGQEYNTILVKESAVYLSRAYQLIDEKYNLDIGITLPIEYWKKHEPEINKILGVVT